MGNGPSGEIEAAGCAVPLWVRKRPALSSAAVSGWVQFGEGGMGWWPELPSYPCFPFAQVLVQELEEHQVRSPFGKRWGWLG